MPFGRTNLKGDCVCFHVVHEVRVLSEAAHYIPLDGCGGVYLMKVHNHKIPMWKLLPAFSEKVIFFFFSDMIKRTSKNEYSC